MSTHNVLSLVKLTNIVDGNSPIWFLDKNLQVRNSKPDIDEWQVSVYGKHLSFAFNGKTKWFP